MNKSDLGTKFAKYHSAIRYIENLGNVGNGYQKTNLKKHPRPQIFLERMQDFLDLLGNPEKGFKYIHITGTAGKGTVATTVHSALVKAKRRAGLFTSPFTVSTIEKIQVGEKYIDPTVFAKIVQTLKPKIDEMLKSGRHGTPSYFEIIFAIALLYFKKEKCEYVVLEVGLGGKYDATNIIKNPVITAITNIGLDHTEILGPRREDIALDKAGIIKRGSTFFTTEEDPKLIKLFADICKKNMAECVALNARGMDYKEKDLLLVNAIFDKLEISNSGKMISQLSELPARFEIVNKKPIIIIDGAHNPSKIKSTVYNLQKLKYNKMTIVFASSLDKDWKTMLKIITPYADNIYITRFSVLGRRSANPSDLSAEVKKYRSSKYGLQIYSDPVDAFNDAKKKLKKGDALLITGSFYLAGEIRALYCGEDQILENRNSMIK
ncbi:MAG: Mur ligase family protein [Candidatus Paceibacterota bacterium]|jgi:dihydrofolate synthase/folylpolyglutamate synthase